MLRRTVNSVAFVCCVLVLAACGSSSSDDDSSPSDGAASARTIDSAQGRVELKGTPKRIVLLGGGQPLDFALTLGVPLNRIVGTDFRDQLEETTTAPYLAPLGDLKKLQAVGANFTPNLEKIASLSPDLIVQSGDLGITKKLKGIAPTVELPEELQSLDDRLKWYASVYAADKATIPAFKKQLAERRNQFKTTFREKYGEETSQNSVAMLRFFTGGDLELHGQENTEFGLDLAGLGFTFDPSTKAFKLVAPGAFSTLSLEKVGRIDSDVLFWFAQPAFDNKDTINEDIAEITGSAIWQEAKAVKNGEVYPVDRSGAQWRNNGPRGSLARIDAFAAALGMTLPGA